MGQCTPSTSREAPTRKIHTIAMVRDAFPSCGRIRIVQIAAAIAMPATASVCPLGKLEPQYVGASHNEGRSRPTKVFITRIVSPLQIPEDASNAASNRRWVHHKATAAIVVTGVRNIHEPVSVTNSKNRMAREQTASRSESRARISITWVSPSRTSLLTLSNNNRQQSQHHQAELALVNRSRPSCIRLIGKQSECERQAGNHQQDDSKEFDQLKSESCCHSDHGLRQVFTGLHCCHCCTVVGK